VSKGRQAIYVFFIPMKNLHKITFILLVVGGLNWLLQGAFGWDIGAYLPGGMAGTLARVIYVLVGLSAIYLIVDHKNSCKYCAPGMGGSM